jgi:hypothetical protein
MVGWGVVVHMRYAAERDGIVHNTQKGEVAEGALAGWGAGTAESWLHVVSLNAPLCECRDAIDPLPQMLTTRAFRTDEFILMVMSGCLHAP